MSVKILHLDLETAPNQAYTWGLFKQNISLNQIVKPGYTLCFAAKWHGSKKTVFKSVHKDGMEAMVETMWDLLDEADIVVHYNGKKFDIPVINREFVLHQYVPPSPYKQIDLYHVVRSNFKFASNKLDFVAQQLGLGAKVSHRGMDLWTECMAGNRKANKEMKEYNIQDVALTEKLYEILVPWIKNAPNLGMYMDNGDTPTCRNCGSTHLHKRGIERTNTLSYQRYKCQDCGANNRSRTRLEATPKGVLV